MKIDSHELPETAPQEVVQQVRKEPALVGSATMPKGHTMFIVELKPPYQIYPATYEETVVEFGSKEVRKKLIVPKDCIPVSALNKKNVIKKIQRMYR